MRPLTLTLALLLLSSAAYVRASDGDEGCCAHCRCQDDCCKTCRLVCEMKEIKKVKYKVVCEDFCTMGHSEGCGCCKKPTCECVRTRTKLVKYEEVEKVPSYKCVVQYLCPKCQGTLEDSIKAAQSPIAAPR